MDDRSVRSRSLRSTTESWESSVARDAAGNEKEAAENRPPFGGDSEMTNLDLPVGARLPDILFVEFIIVIVSILLFFHIT